MIATLDRFTLVEIIEETLTRRAERSLFDYLGCVSIKCEPEPQAWDRVIEPWQIEHLVRPLAPAIESAAGLRPDYSGPRDFWIELPKGHDKTSFIGRLANWVVGFAPSRCYGAIGASSIDQAARLLERATEEAHLNPWLHRRVEHGLKVMRGAGGVMQVISSDAPKSSGRTDDLVICDELTFWESRDLWDVLRPGRIKRRHQVFVVITNAGVVGSWQWELREQARTSPQWYFYASPPGKFLASWMDAKAIDDLKDSVNPIMRRRVILNEWVLATENPLLTPELVHACHGKCLWKHGLPPDKGEPIGELYLGFDVGRARDRSVASIIELRGETAMLRRLIVWDNMPLEQQEHRLAELVALYRKHLKAVRIDRGTLGYQIAETMERKFPGVAQGVSMSQVWQGAAAGKLYRLFERRALTIPNETELSADLQQVSTVGTTKGGQPIVQTSRTDVGHADRFWSLALAIDAMPDKQRKRSTAAPRGFRSRI